MERGNLCWIVTFISLILSATVLCQTVITTIPDTDDGDAYVVAQKGQNSSLECTVLVSGTQFATAWFIQRQSIETNPVELQFSSSEEITTPADLSDDIIVTGEILLLVSSRTNLTILNFTEQFDGTLVQCGRQNNRRNFNLGFPVSPTVNKSLGTQYVVEGDNIIVDLSVVGAATPFPPVSSSLWTYEGQSLNDSDTIALTQTTIHFINTKRSSTGTYMLILTNAVGSANGSFDLNVQYSPEAIPVGGATLIVLSGSSIVLTAFTSSTIDGNPLPTISWTGPDGLVRNTSGRFNTTIPGQITITDILTTDNGTYTCTISNGIGTDLNQTLQLIVAIPADAPQNLSVTNVTDTTANLTWSAPTDNLGVPELSYYLIKVTPPPPSDVVLNTTGTSLFLYGIIPNTMYNVSVVGVSTGDNFDVLKGAQSSGISFQTIPGVPQFMSVTATPTNGNIVLKWTFRHIGGADSIDIDIYCQINDEGSGSRITDTLSCESDGCVTDNVMGTANIGPVLAGETYYCSISAINTGGADTRTFEDIVVTEGLPSVPIVVSHQLLPGIVRLTLRVVSIGTTNGTFRYIIDIITSSDSSLLRTDVIPLPALVNNQTIARDILIPDGGTFSFNIRAANVFGVSEDEIVIQGLIVDPAPPSLSTSSTIITTPTTEPTTSTSAGTASPSISTTSTATSNTPTLVGASEGGLSGGAIAGIVIGIIILLAIIAIIVFIVIFIIYQNRGGTYEVEKGRSSRPKVVVEEHDIDIGLELDDSVKKSHATATATTAAETQPKQELHYADLADFNPIKKSNPSAPPTAKPMPIEEVQYACIRPQDQKKLEKTDASDENMM